MTASAPCILYMSGTLPARSETFVTREVLGLRRRGIDVRIASVHAPETDLGDVTLDGLAREAIPIYSSGVIRLFVDAMAEFFSHPIRALGTVMRAKLDVLFGSGVPPDRKPKVLWQCIAGFALARRARTMGIDHIHAHMAHVPTTIAMYAARQLGCTCSFTGHAVDLFRHRTLLREKLERSAFVSCISEWHRSFYREIVSRRDVEFPIVRCGVDVSEFQPPDRDKSREPMHVVSVGRFVEKKGFDLLVRAVQALHAEGRAIRCTIAGDGPQRDALIRLTESTSLESSFELPGARANHEVRALMQEADLFVLPCRVDETGDRDGIPVVLMEAMACGVCAVSGDLPAIRELIEDDRSGRLVASDDLEGLTNILRMLVVDHEARRRLGQAGRARVMEEFSLETNLDRIESAFESVLGPVRGRQSTEMKVDASPSTDRGAAAVRSGREYMVGDARSA